VSVTTHIEVLGDPAEARSVTDAVAGSTVVSDFLATTRRRADAPALRWRTATGFAELTWSQYAERAARVAGGLRALGIRRGDRVALMMRNRPEFHLADMGALLAGATPFSIYNSSAPEQIAYLLGHSGAVAAIVEDGALLERLTRARGELPELRDVFVIEPEGAPPRTRTFAELLAGAPVDVDAAAAAIAPEDLCTLVYTSGTTGPPKGAMTTHANVCWALETYRRALDGVGLEGRRIVSYLPMAHVLERDFTHWLGVREGLEVTTCPDPAQIGAYLRDVRPELFAAVPRVWEKLSAAIRSAPRGPDAEAAFVEGLAVGAEAAELRCAGRPLPEALRERWLRAELLALAPARELAGLDACVSAFTGGAPIPEGVLRFFLALGVPLGEGYGMTESTFIYTFAPFRVRPRTVGPPMPGALVTLAPDGEVLTRGGGVFAGYLGDPQRTAEAIDADGWLHTGDIGAFDEAGYLRIVDRKKELIITAGGKNVSPANLEAALKSHPLIGQACVVGDGRPFLAALIVLDPEVARAWTAGRDVGDDLAALAGDARLRAEIEHAVATVNASVARAEQIKRFCVLHEDWEADSDVLTPTMKLRRRGVAARYADEIDGLYTG
jgi:long-chain acyl-CoA synthetase